MNLKHRLKITGIRGIAHSLKNALTKKTSTISITKKTVKHPIHLRIPSSDSDVYRQIFLKKEYEFDTTKEPEVIIDAGANVGLGAIYFANRYPNAKIFALEPEASNLAMLGKNTEKYENITVIHGALWNKNEEISLYDSGLGEWAYMAGSSETNKSKEHDVKAYTVDAIMAMHSLEKIDILKIDIEGSEKEVFENTSQWINSVESIIIELHDNMKPGCSRSFYNGSEGFPKEWQQGENIYLSKGIIKYPMEN